MNKFALYMLASFFFPMILNLEKDNSTYYFYNKAFGKNLNNIEQISTPSDSIPGITVTDKKGKKTALRMNELDIKVVVIGNIARTTMSMNFENKTKRILEGELNFPLGDGQTITRFAMDVNGKLREAVPVEKQKGQKVFEAVIRKNIDPGLLEKTIGNNFKARIYPIPAKGNKRVVIAFEQELIGVKQGNLYLLPLNFKDKLDKFGVKVEVFMQDVKPKPEKNELANFEFIKYKKNYVAQKKMTQYKANKQIGFVLPYTNNIYKSYIEKSRKSTDDDYFYVNLKIEKQISSKKLPKKICILFDVSASLEKKDTLKEFKVLNSYFNNIKNLEVELVSFSNEIHNKKTYKIKNGNWSELKKDLTQHNYDGATQLGILNLQKYKCDEFILISDGISNFGKSEIISGSTPVMVLTSVQSANFSYLKYITQSTGGRFINLNNKTVDQALNILTKQNFRFISANFDKNSIKEAYPNKPTDFENNFSIAGQLKSKAAEITLNFGYGNKVFKSVKVRLNKKNIIIENNLIQHIWACKKLEDLDMMYEKNKDEITDLGKKYNIVTRNTSLIILDRLEDYVQNEIVPPKELQNEYFKIVENKKLQQIEFEKSQIDKVIELYADRIKWWKTKYTKERIKIDNNKDKLALQDDTEVANNVDDDREGSPALEQSDETSLEIQKKEDQKTKKTKASIKLNAWNPGTPYMNELKKAKYTDMYSVYLKLKKEYKSTPSFFLDISDYFIKKGKKKQALRILSNIAELDLQNHELLRILAHRLEQLKYYKLAIRIYEEVVKIRAEEPQSYRDLALCLAADKQYQKAIEIIYKAVKKNWDSRFPGIGEIMVYEMNKIIADAGSKVNTKDIEPRLLKNLPSDIRIVLNWDTDNSDMDLWVTDPYDVKCFYSHKRTYTGGHMSNDFTSGYGPEEFLIKNAIKGKYIVQANYYGSTAQRITGPTTIYLELYTNYGKPNQKKEVITMRLSDKKEVVNIGELIFN